MSEPTEELKGNEPKREKVRIIPVELIDDFPDHPFQVKDDESMAQLVSSIEMNGVLNPVMLTAVIIVGYLAKWLPELVTVVSIGMIIIYLIAGILLMKALFDLRRSISSDSDSNNTDTDLETEEI